MAAFRPSRYANGSARCIPSRLLPNGRSSTTMGETRPNETTLDVEQIKALLPHRAPFLFVEKLADIVPHESATGYKAVSFNEPHFQGHFPAFAVMPGVLIVEAMAQTAGALVGH